MECSLLQRLDGSLRGVVPALALIAILIPSKSFSEERTVTLDEAYRVALANNESVKIASEGVRQAESTLDKTTSRILPNLTAEGSYTKYSEQKTTSSGFVIQPDDASRVDVKLTQPLYTGGREWATRKQAKFNIQRSKEGLDLAKEDIIRSTARAYFGALKAEKDVEIKAAALKRAEERLKVADARFKVGEVTKSAVLRAEAEAAGAEAELIKSKSALKDAGNLLKTVLGVQEDIKTAEPLVEAVKVPEAGELVRLALEARSDYRQRALEEKAALEGIEYAKGNFKPQIRIEGLYSWREQNPQTTFFQEDSKSASVVLTYPLFEGGLRMAELKEARSKLRESEFKRLSLKRDIEYEVRNSYNNMVAIEALINSYRKQLAFAEEDYSMVFEQFKYGLATTVDVIDSDATLISAQRSLMNATYDYQLAAIEVRYAAGILFEEVFKAQRP